MDRATNREVAVFVRGQDVYDLAALGDEFQNFSMIDNPHG